MLHVELGQLRVELSPRQKRGLKPLQLEMSVTLRVASPAPSSPPTSWYQQVCHYREAYSRTGADPVSASESKGVNHGSHSEIPGSPDVQHLNMA